MKAMLTNWRTLVIALVLGAGLFAARTVMAQTSSTTTLDPFAPTATTSTSEAVALPASIVLPPTRVAVRPPTRSPFRP